MALPNLIEIVPLSQSVQAQITVPGSKSITNRALVLAALSHSEVTLKGALWSEDTQVMVDCLWKLGFEINVMREPAEPCNRTIEMIGRSGGMNPGGTEMDPLDLFVDNAGTTARFLTAMVCLGFGVYRLQGVDRMHERPQKELFDALRQIGYRIDSPNDFLPAAIHGTGPLANKGNVSIEKSSQFASALLLCAYRGKWDISLLGASPRNAPYVNMTNQLIKAFPHSGGEFQIEPDASSGSYFWGADWLLSVQGSPNPSLNQITVSNWPTSGWQQDADFQSLRNLQSRKNQTLSRNTNLADSIMTAIAMAPLNDSPVTFTDLGRLRVQECERVLALRTELTKCGANVVEEGDTLTVYPSQLYGAEIETYNDHRMAMCFAMLGLKVPGMKISNPACVKKTFPNFFQKLAFDTPYGLGARIIDAYTGNTLFDHELFAD